MCYRLSKIMLNDYESKKLQSRILLDKYEREIIEVNGGIEYVQQFSFGREIV